MGNKIATKKRKQDLERSLANILKNLPKLSKKQERTLRISFDNERMPNSKEAEKATRAQKGLANAKRKIFAKTGKVLGS